MSDSPSEFGSQKEAEVASVSDSIIKGTRRALQGDAAIDFHETNPKYGVIWHKRLAPLRTEDGRFLAVPEYSYRPEDPHTLGLGHIDFNIFDTERHIYYSLPGGSTDLYAHLNVYDNYPPGKEVEMMFATEENDRIEDNDGLVVSLEDLRREEGEEHTDVRKETINTLAKVLGEARVDQQTWKGVKDYLDEKGFSTALSPAVSIKANNDVNQADNEIRTMVKDAYFPED